MEQDTMINLIDFSKHASSRLGKEVMEARKKYLESNRPLSLNELNEVVRKLRSDRDIE